MVFWLPTILETARDDDRWPGDHPRHPSRPPRPAELLLRGRRFDAARPAVMAIVNRTSDSFFAGNRYADRPRIRGSSPLSVG